LDSITSPVKRWGRKSFVIIAISYLNQTLFIFGIKSPVLFLSRACIEFSILVMIFMGLVTGLMTGLTGASGVGVVVPMLIILLGFSIYEAIGARLEVDIIASLLVIVTYLKPGLVYRTEIWIAIGSIMGAQIGALIATRLAEGV